MNDAENGNHEIGSTGDYFDRLQRSKGSNRDTAGLGTMAVGPFVVGGVDAINSENGKEMPEFVPTRHELKKLAEYWALERLERDFYWFVCQQTGSSEWRWSVHITRRLDRLSEVLGPEAMRTAREAAVASFRRHRAEFTDEDWRVFTEGAEEEQEAWRATTGTMETTKRWHGGPDSFPSCLPAWNT
jgi:hypothetical protein